MPVEVILPKVDMDMTHGTLATWHVKPGDMVQKGAALFDIETDKAAMEVEAPATGRLQHVLAEPGTKVPVGSVIAWLYAEGETVDTLPPVPAPGDVPAEAAVPDAPALGGTEQAPYAVPPQGMAGHASPMPGGSLLRATPAARHAARTAGLDLSDVAGSGPRGRIQKQDVDDLLARERDVAPPRPVSGWVADSGPLAVTRRPGRDAPLVLIHGFAADSTGWLPLEKALLPGRALIRIDLPGHGRSPKRKIRDFAHLARMVLEAFDEATRGLDGVHLLGHSLGGAVAAAIADIRSSRVLSLTAMAPAGLGPDINGEMLAGIARATRVESLSPWLRQLAGNAELIGDDYAKAAMRGRADPGLRSCQMEMAEVLFPDGVQAFDLRPAFARLSMPASIVWGRRDQVTPFRHALSIEADFALHFLHGIGHIPHFECPERVARIVERQFAAVEAPG
ncbi:acetoin dehydrogenase dihydrolipoyllysine-residue acetyltransferase subunit [Rhizobium straminoryzae]|uniref:Acetoin dehydrogenase dihydrolipoyllysine-residue acetyltransferase subunit n=1 Tax=Rhizobium straminoryzae TaxID=1387186 RepID=A0A549TFE6_9HYPH|nr:acetoin dehydrogenase dihydrolipoyllysine-residue acetyltransferase subunit [Rhizobium straminoryzae]TRL41244.1 acetoin dehydrogenase dihydrolipoyllysine-residue acetyltransferase subunit [Rhizobium straminoryzae]